jgi:DNA polymerase-3 subunit epsilon
MTMGPFTRLFETRQPGQTPVGPSALAPPRDSPHQAEFAVIDVETTGLSPKQNRVLELGIVLTDHSGSPLWEWVSRSTGRENRLTSSLRIHRCGF